MEDKSTTQPALANAFNVVPKFCTNIQVGVLESKNIVISLFFGNPPGNSVLIDTIMIDNIHARQFASVLNKAIEEMEK